MGIDNLDNEDDITQILLQWHSGNPADRDRLMRLVFQQLKWIARRHLALERPGHTLQPTDLVHELYLKLEAQDRSFPSNRRQFFAFAAELIRRILVDHARRRRAKRRGGDHVTISIEEITDIPMAEDSELIELDDALKQLAEVDPRGHRVVELHVFAGLRFEEIAEVLDISRSTALRDWNHSRLWLRRKLQSYEESA